MFKKIVLVVDDVGINRLLPGMMLRPFGIEVHECSSGTSALAYLKENIVELVLLDISMPILSGMDVLRKIKENPKLKSVRVLAYTAYADPEDQHALMMQGFDGVIIKPLKFDVLVRFMK